LERNGKEIWRQLKRQTRWAVTAQLLYWAFCVAPKDDPSVEGFARAMSAVADEMERDI
jgi:hypothetical protein